MVEIVRLKPGETPSEPDFVLVEPIRHGRAEMIPHAQGVTYRVREEHLDYEVACLQRRLEETGLEKLYIREREDPKQG
jgi:hypothetical protein